MNTKLVGKTIANLRKRVGYTQKDLALRIGISDKAVSKWERGVGLPDIGYLNKLAILLNTDAESLLAGQAAINENAWQGILSIETTPEIGYLTYIYDKPLISYLLGYFMLLGIKSILIFCNEKEKNQISEEIGDGSKLGVELIVSCQPLSEQMDLITPENVMLIYDKCVLYGVDQTRFFQRAMQHRDTFSLLAFPKHGKQLTHLIKVDEDRKIVNLQKKAGLKSFYDYSYIPFLFCDRRLLKHYQGNSQDFVNYLIENVEGYAEALDRGFVEIELNSWKDVSEASMFVSLVQDKCGMEIYCLEEIAWRRGMISFKQFKQFSDEYAGTSNGEYIKSLCERYQRRHENE